jgi:hypothetical protein
MFEVRGSRFGEADDGSRLAMQCAISALLNGSRLALKCAISSSLEDARYKAQDTRRKVQVNFENIEILFA